LFGGELFVAKINEALGLTQDRVSLANEGAVTS